MFHLLWGFLFVGNFCWDFFVAEIFGGREFLGVFGIFGG
jgi:hypothetical protein